MRLTASLGAWLLVSSPMVLAQDRGAPPPRAQPPGAPAVKTKTRPAAPAVSPTPVASELAGQVPREIRFRGNTQISAEALRQRITSKAGQPINPAQLESDLTALEEEYHRRGFGLMRAL